MRMALSSELSAWIASRVASYPAEQPEQLHWLTASVKEAGAFPLYVGWVDVIGLRPDGEIVQWNTEGDYPGTQAVEDRYLWLTSLVDAVNRHPELRPLLPKRPPGARDCQHLAHPLFSEGKVFCPECCGLGWIESSSNS